jgi:hypothetical protein
MACVMIISRIDMTRIPRTIARNGYREVKSWHASIESPWELGHVIAHHNDANMLHDWMCDGGDMRAISQGKSIGHVAGPICMKQWIDSGGSWDVRDDLGMTPIMALICNMPDMPTMHAVHNSERLRLLHRGRRKQRACISIMEHWQRDGGDIMISHKNYGTIGHMMAIRGLTSLLKWWYDADADPSQTSANGITIGDIAICCGYLGCYHVWLNAMRRHGRIVDPHHMGSVAAHGSMHILKRMCRSMKGGKNLILKHESVHMLGYLASTRRSMSLYKRWKSLGGDISTPLGIGTHAHWSIGHYSALHGFMPAYREYVSMHGLTTDLIQAIGPSSRAMAMDAYHAQERCISGHVIHSILSHLCYLVRESGASDHHSPKRMMNGLIAWMSYAVDIHALDDRGRTCGDVICDTAASLMDSHLGQLLVPYMNRALVAWISAGGCVVSTWYRYPHCRSYIADALRHHPSTDPCMLVTAYAISMMTDGGMHSRDVPWTERAHDLAIRMIPCIEDPCVMASWIQATSLPSTDKSRQAS